MPHKLLPSRFLIQRRPAAMEAIRRHYCDFGCSPSFAEIAARIGVSVTHIGAIVRSLAQEGAIGWTAGKARSITLPRPLSRASNSELLLELQRRGLPLVIAARSPVASAWPEATLVDVDPQETQVEHALLAEIDEIDGRAEASGHGTGKEADEDQGCVPGASGGQGGGAPAGTDRPGGSRCGTAARAA